VRHPVVRAFVQRIRPLKDQISGLYLFGSRARGDARPDSDFDVLVVVPRRSQALKDRLYDAVVEVSIETGLLVSLKIYTTEQYDAFCAIPTPFMANVKAEGVKIGFDD
jgi:predicted nucleotidyltransferase